MNVWNELEDEVTWPRSRSGAYGSVPAFDARPVRAEGKLCSVFATSTGSWHKELRMFGKGFHEWLGLVDGFSQHRSHKSIVFTKVSIKAKDSILLSLGNFRRRRK